MEEECRRRLACCACVLLLVQAVQGVDEVKKLTKQEKIAICHSIYLLPLQFETSLTAQLISKTPLGVCLCACFEYAICPRMHTLLRRKTQEAHFLVSLWGPRNELHVLRGKHGTLVAKDESGFPDVGPTFAILDG